jgi:hypothetical protein
MDQKFAFRCKRCGRLETSDHAAESEVPHACSVCGGGVVFKHQELSARLLAPGLTQEQLVAIARELNACNPAAKTFQPEIWEILADCDSAQLAEYGLTYEQVERHEPWPKQTDAESRAPKHVRVAAVERVGGANASSQKVVAEMSHVTG